MYLHVYVVVLSIPLSNKKNQTVPQVEIRGAPDIYVMAGSGVALHCVISGLIETPPYIFWYHKTERIAGSALEESRMFESSKEAAALASSGLYYTILYFYFFLNDEIEMKLKQKNKNRRYEIRMERSRHSSGSWLSSGRLERSSGHARLCRQLFMWTSEPTTGQRHSPRSKWYAQ